MKKNQLLIREWLAVALILGLLGSFIVIAHLSQVEVKKELINSKIQAANEVKLQIELSGEVERPGIYYVSPGTSLKSILKEAGLTKKADRKQINLKKIFYSSEKIELIAKKKK